MKVDGVEVTIKTTETQTVEELVDLAIKHKLYVSGWLLFRELEAIKNGVLDAEMAIAFNNNIPIAISVIIKNCKTGMDNIQVFVRKAYRRNGIGTKLVSTLCKQREGIFAFRGIKHSVLFFSALGIKSEIFNTVDYNLPIIEV